MAKYDEFGNPIPDTQPNLFAQQKMQNYPTAASVVQKAPGQVIGETPEQFAAGKQAANSSYNGTKQAVQPVQPVYTPVVPQRQNYVPQQQIDPNSSTDGVDSILGHFTSPQEEEKYRKASVARQRIMAVGDALRHIGNIYHTTRYAPSQKFNMPAEAERKRYLQEKSLRDKANQRIISYQQAKQKLDNDHNRWEQQFKYNMAKDAANYELKKNESEARQQRQKALAELDKARLEGVLDKNTYQRLVNQYYPEQAEARVREIESRIAKNNRTGGGRSSGGGKGSTYWDYDEEGKIHYYPNKTMWEQGVESHSRNQQQQEEFKTIDGYGETKKTYKKRSTASKAGENASNAQRRGGAMSNFSINGNKNQQKKASNVSRFSIKK